MHGDLPILQGKEWQEKQENIILPASQLKFTLASYAADFHFFNHGALFTYTGLKFPEADPVADWWQRQPKDTVVIKQSYAHKLFEGLRAPWNNTICAVHHHNWPSLLAFVGGVATIDEEAKQYRQVFSGDLELPDPSVASTHGILHLNEPKITVTVFCVDGNEARWEVRPPIGLMGPARFVKVEPRTEVVAMGNAVLSGDISKLQHKDNPAYQPLLDKFKALVQSGAISQ